MSDREILEQFCDTIIDLEDCKHGDATHKMTVWQKHQGVTAKEHMNIDFNTGEMKVVKPEPIFFKLTLPCGLEQDLMIQTTDVTDDNGIASQISERCLSFMKDDHLKECKSCPDIDQIKMAFQQGSLKVAQEEVERISSRKS